MTRPPLVVGLFGHHERAMFTQEILQQVVIGMARLDVLSDAESAHPDPEEAAPQVELDRSNPYFPPSPPAAASSRSCTQAMPHGILRLTNHRRDFPTRPTGPSPFRLAQISLQPHNLRPHVRPQPFMRCNRMPLRQAHARRCRRHQPPNRRQK